MTEIPSQPNSYTKVLAAWQRMLRRWKRKHPKPKPPHPAPHPAPHPHPHPHPPAGPVKGCDYVSGPSTLALHGAGIKFVMRYLSTPGNPKNITKSEARALRSAGIAVGLVFETTASRALSGAAGGKSDARSARAQANALGFPHTLPIYYAVDFDPNADEARKVVGYFSGIASVETAARVGVYGGIEAVHAVLSAGKARYGWQTYAWSGGKWDARAQIRQVENGVRIGGAGVDIDHAVHADAGLWKP